MLEVNIEYGSAPAALRLYILNTVRINFIGKLRDLSYPKPQLLPKCRQIFSGGSGWLWTKARGEGRRNGAEMI
jgi:hypothetical protein